MGGPSRALSADGYPPGMPDDLRQAGELLRDLYTAPPTSKSHDAEHLTAFYEKHHDDTTAAVALTLLALARLSAHVEHELGIPFLSITDEYEPLPRPDDEHARALAAAVVARAARARELDPNDNLGAFAAGLAHELRGEKEQAAAAYREAVRLDRYDHPAIARLETLTDEDFTPSEYEPACSHPGAFYLLDMTSPTREDGTRERLILLSTNDEAVRAEVDAYFATRELGHDELDYSLETHRPGRESENEFLLMALEDHADGPVAVDWDLVEMPPLTDPLLPEGRPIRENGEVHFFGRNVFAEEVEEEEDDLWHN